MAVAKVQTAALQLRKFNQNGWGLVRSFVNCGCAVGGAMGGGYGPEAIFKKIGAYGKYTDS